MANVVIYTSSATGMLKVKKDQASLKFLLEKKKVGHVEKDVATDSDARAEMKVASGRTDLPQLFVDGAFIGTYDHACELEEMGELNAKLGL
ncbi:glutaredoxin [Streptomyces anulatus]|uniref:glutaredoxin n=1 Tax=Streptomyces TaxID=1883 RepID=UPI000BFC0EC2|nr:MULTISPECIES: glutaredoxin [Streptomyces]MCX4502183.1 glutaredoxin [Streptomyces anulatus]WTC75285.1 glutaredoxin [Streptomyces anulatus]WUD87328.1 glutaredoxin [Streptomyces anulatus]